MSQAKTKEMPAKPEWQSLRVPPGAGIVGVDRQARVIRGYVLAQEGPFKSEGRGEFDVEAIESIVSMVNGKPGGLKSRFKHPSLSDDGLGKHLGRARDARVSKVRVERGGKMVTLRAARGDLHLADVASKSPDGDLAQYVMDLAEEDPDALSSSLVLKADLEYRLDEKGRPLEGEDGEPLPPLWRPLELHASDIVDTGDAVDGLLSPEDLAQALSVGVTDDLRHLLRFDRVARLGAQLLDGLFRGQKREAVEARCSAWLARYLDHRYGGPDAEPEIPAEPKPKLDALRERLAKADLAARRRGT